MKSNSKHYICTYYSFDFLIITFLVGFPKGNDDLLLTKIAVSYAFHVFISLYKAKNSSYLIYFANKYQKYFKENC